MDIQSLKTMLEIQALQALGSTGNASVNSFTNSNSLFSSMLSDILLSGATTTNNSALTSLLGMTSASSTNIMEQLSNFTGISDATTNSSLQSLFYNGTKSVYIPPAVHTALAQMQSRTSPDTYVSDDVIGSTAYANALAGANKYAAIIDKAAATYHVPAKLIAAVIKQESNFNPSVVSHAGAQGLMQLMPKTAQFLGVTNSFDPEQNIMAGTNYLRQMLDKFDNDPTLALAAYNAGASRVKKYNGIPPFKETQNYVKKVMNYYTV